MNISIFEVIGPIMIGPSSSHTAGAARLGLVGRKIVGSSIAHVSFGLHGSFAKTYYGHGTDKALVAGVLGMSPDDERLPQAFEIAEKEGLTYDFHEVELPDSHENTVQMTFFLKNGVKHTIIGSSIGGGQILITELDGLPMNITAQSPTLLVSQQDKKGVISDVTKILSDKGINIGTMQVSRDGKGNKASMIIETDSHITEEVIEAVRKQENVLNAQAIYF